MGDFVIARLHLSASARRTGPAPTVEVLALLITGGLAGWTAGKLMRGAGYGLVSNVVLGIVGGLIGGKLFALVGVRPDGWLIEVAMAVVGAVLLLALVALVRGRPAE